MGAGAAPSVRPERAGTMSGHGLRHGAIALAALLALACGAPASAHSLSVAHLDIEAAPGATVLHVELDLAVRDLALGLPLDADHDERVTWGELRAVRAPLEAMVLRGLRIRDAGGDCALRPEQLGLRRYDDGAYATVVLAARCRTGTALAVHYALLFDTDPQHRALVTMHRGDDATTAIARADARDIALPAGHASPFAAFVREGVRHILSGYDHLAFLLSLLLPAPLLWLGRRWQPATGWRPVLSHTVGLVTAFTVAHSITLTLAALGAVRPSTRLVEAGIALSVLLAALNNLWPVATRRLWLAAFGFGLVHGLGFAGALLETGLPRQARLAALLGFNVGVEAGQLAVVALVLPLLFALRRSPRYPVFVLRGGSLLVVLLAGYWLVQRLAP
jgi:hypothetical protein